MRNFRKMLESQWSRGHFVCVGLDTDPRKVPRSARKASPVMEADYDHVETMVAFNKANIDATHDLVCASKTNIAFYEAYGAEGLSGLSRTINHVRRVAPDVPVILDAKRADIGNTNEGYTTMAFDLMQADAITVNPYLGSEALRPFLERADKGIFVLCRTSNPGAGEFQDLPVHVAGYKTKPLYEVVADNIARDWNKNKNCGLVVGATNPEQLRSVRRLIGDMPILIPGIGEQGGSLEKSVAAGKDSRGEGMIINASRSIIYASTGSDFAEAAREETKRMSDLIN